MPQYMCVYLFPFYSIPSHAVPFQSILSRPRVGS